MPDSIGVAVIGAGMAGRAHAAGYRSRHDACTAPDLPRRAAGRDRRRQRRRSPPRPPRRFGYERAETTGRRVADAPDIDVVSVVVANHLHREVVEGLLAAGKHVLCEKPFAPTIADAEAMVAAAEAHRTCRTGGRVHLPPLAGDRGDPRPARQRRAWASRCTSTATTGATTASTRDGPMSWRYKGGPGSGALADIGSHLVDLAEFVCGPIAAVRGAVLTTFVDRARRCRWAPRSATPRPSSATTSRAGRERGPGHLHRRLRLRRHRHVLGVPGRRSGWPTRSASSCSPSSGAATFDLARPGEFRLVDGTRRRHAGLPAGARSGPAHPYLTGGLPMDFPGVGYGQNDLFAFQARAFLEQVAGLDGLPPVPRFARRPAQPAAARRRRRLRRGRRREVASLTLTRPVRADQSTSSRGTRRHEARRLHRLPARQAARARPSTSSPASAWTARRSTPAGSCRRSHLPVDDLRASEDARQDYLGMFASRGVTLTALNCNGNPLHPDPEVRDKHAPGPARLDRARRPARRQAGRDDVRARPAPSPARSCRRGTSLPWDSAYLDARDYQWNEVAIPYWKDIQARAADADVKVCIEMHPHNIVYNPATMERLADRDRRHPRGRRDGPEPPVLAGHRPGRGRRRTSASWSTTPRPRTPGSTTAATVNGVLDDRFGRVRPGRAGRPVPGRALHPQPAGRENALVGLRRRRPRPRRRAGGASSCARCARSTRTWPVNIEHEDQELDQLEGLRSAAETLLEAARKL